MIILIGESGSGKSTIERKLTQEGYSKITSVTTRPPRAGEKDGVDYHFVSEETFAELYTSGQFLETTTYRGWHYGMLAKDYSPGKVIVVELNGLKQIIDHVGRDKLKIFYIKAPERDRMIRMLLRGDDVDEVIRRIQADRTDFTGAEQIADHVVYNQYLGDAMHKIWGLL